MQKISYRKCRVKDIIPASRMIKRAVYALRRKSGKEIKPWRIARRPSPLMVDILKRNPGTMYCAWKNNRIIGFAGAYVNGRQWYLCWLFVDPKIQDKGIGRKLLEKVWRDRKGMTHSLCTFAFNPQAVGLYSRFGMVPLCDLPWLKADPDKLAKLPETDLVPVDKPNRSDIRWLHSLEQEIRGYSHPQHWRIWLKSKPFKFYLFKKGRRRVGYCMITNDMLIAPVGVVSQDYMIDVITEAIRLTQPKKNAKIMFWCPTLNIPLYRYLIRLGFRVDEFEIFMSDAPYPDWQRYVPASLAIL
jgi:GNAT superfamily N-acetyltransferase